MSLVRVLDMRVKVFAFVLGIMASVMALFALVAYYFGIEVFLFICAAIFISVCTAIVAWVLADFLLWQRDQ